MGREKGELPSFMLLGNRVVETRVAVRQLRQSFYGIAEGLIIVPSCEHAELLEKPVRRRGENVILTVPQRQRQQRPANKIVVRPDRLERITDLHVGLGPLPRRVRVLVLCREEFLCELRRVERRERRFDYRKLSVSKLLDSGQSES